jgi:S1-C subfamily serine protease
MVNFLKALVPALAIVQPLFAADPVIDDQALNEQFSKALGEFAEKDIPIQIRQAREILAEAEAKPVSIAAPAAPITVAPDASIYAACLPAVVAVGSVYDCGKCDNWHIGGFATGWIASADGIVVTNHHVLDRQQPHPLGVMTADGAVFPVVEVLGWDKNADIAVVRVDTGGKQLPHLSLAENVSVGDKAFVISNPKRRFFVHTSGVVSRFHYMPRPKGVERPVFMSITADYAVGSSGGPVLSERGEVIGMVASTMTATADRPPAEEGGERRELVQMVFKDCVALQELRKTIGYAEKADDGE